MLNRKLVFIYVSSVFMLILVFIATPSFTKDEEGNTFTNSLGMEFVYIKPGTFMMGNPMSGEGRHVDEKQHQVTLTEGFYIGVTEVTQIQWQKVMGNNPSYFKDCGNDCPVENVSWEDTQEFIQKLNSMEGTDKYRLPTEAQWEYAVRAGTTTRFYTGDSEADLSRAGWYNKNSELKTHPVGQKTPNAWGLYDMHGNLWEWVQDRYRKDYQNNSEIDPKGPSSGSRRVVRDCNFHDGMSDCGSYVRGNWASSTLRDKYFGFRLIRTQ